MASPYTIKCSGIVAYGEQDWAWEELLTREPKEDEFLVEMIATGICHTDIAGYGGIYPRVLGHEGAGRVVRLGSEDQRQKFAEGDLVILSAAACLVCAYCKTGHPAYCVYHAALTSAADSPDFVLARDPSRVVGGGFFGQSSFASRAPVKVSCAANVTALIRDAAELTAYAPLGCGIMTGAGAITHVGRCGPDDVLAVVGLGGVGLAAVCAAKRLSVRTVIAVDRADSRVRLAESLGATHGLAAPGEGDLAAALRGATPEALGCTHILDATPSVQVLGECLEALRRGGTVLQVGLKPEGARLAVDLRAHMVNGRRLVGVLEGDRDPAEALPELVSWVRDGSLPLDRLLRHFPAGEFAAARAGMESGEVIKSVLVWQ
ncbi:Alcohol dehydrogenase superfamily, zinc-type [Cordyceps fumosorosea ARSEF 2679]|uniref:Alcohol dehydrogenase superfamily, zinc-type n=1 Tax=Cordyceps fumosorosea (strain ARSEF 2679) TaxID=1081104 RepID=A0A167N505_CORFA|nr:Alcohol dehydrogenase superfamily, zinc-type [Cordyceps fumosorosea ARSEF 2679]OAA55133.1 Alcohol dehydrogenase superfamily, zinc-type [Cordyceps fumosorosea ARSEF 2679]